MTRHRSCGPACRRLAHLLDGGRVTPRDLDLYGLVVLAEALRRQAPVGPDPAFRTRLRDRLIAEAGGSHPGE